MKKIIAILGPTASGKSSLAIKLARKFNGEIISADSRQIYKGMNIGTAKEINSVISHYMIDIIKPNQRFSVGDYQKQTYKIIDKIHDKGKIPFLVGGTGLYIDAVLRGYDWQSKNNPRDYKGGEKKYNCLELGIDIAREKLYSQINKRVVKMVKDGLIEEVEELVKRYGKNAHALKETIGYKEILHNYSSSKRSESRSLNNISSRLRSNNNSIIKQIQANTRAYARRQITWFRHHGDIHWVKDYREAKILIKEFLNK